MCRGTGDVTVIHESLSKATTKPSKTGKFGHERKNPIPGIKCPGLDLNRIAPVF